MAKIKPIQIKDGSHLIRLIEALASEVVDAHIHFKLFMDLRDAVQTNERVIAQSRAFWSLTIKSHYLAAVSALGRCYDQHGDALSLASWLRTIRENMHLFSEESFRVRLKNNPFVESLAESPRIPELKQIDHDITLVEQGKCETVKKLATVRNTHIAHIDSRRFLADNLGDSLPSIDETQALLDRAIQIVNRYSTLFQAKTYSTQIVGHDDFKSVIKMVGDQLDQIESDIQEKISSHEDSLS